MERLSSLNSFGMSLLKLTMDPPVEVTGNIIFGLFQPYYAESDLVLQHQLRRAPDHYQHPNTPPSNVFVTNEANINNDYPLVAIEHSKLYIPYLLIALTLLSVIVLGIFCSSQQSGAVSELAYLSYIMSDSFFA